MRVRIASKTSLLEDIAAFKRKKGHFKKGLVRTCMYLTFWTRKKITLQNTVIKKMCLCEKKRVLLFKYIIV